jgi:phosphohistidine swiveling domain-containing protein
MMAVLAGDALTDAAQAGGKGAALARLGAAFRVPAFFVISAEAFDETGLKSGAADAVRAALAALGPGPFAVRSSGREEDGAGAAHAGQFDTELNVGAQDVEAAAHRVWRSGFSETLAAYRRAHGLSDAPQPPAVIVQTMVRALSAGVAFSADPLSGDRGVCVISAIRGLADRLVSGDADGDSYRVGADGRTLDAQLVDGAEVLGGAQRAEVAALARRAEAHFGSPQDIEWAFDDGGLKLLQSRPITTLGDLPQTNDAEGQKAELTIWDNSNIVESYPGVVSPLTFSFARYVYSHVYQAFALLMRVEPGIVEERRAVFENMLGRVDGRVYYNLLNWYRALALFPGFKANRAFMEGMMGVSEPLPQEIAERIAPPVTDAGELARDKRRLWRVGLGLVAQEMRIRTTISRFYMRLNRALAKGDADIRAMSLTELAAEYRELEQQLLAKWDAPLVNDFLCMIAFGVTQKAMTKWAGGEGAEFLGGVLIGQGDIISAEPARRIREMGRMAAKVPGLPERLAAGDVSGIDASAELRDEFHAYIVRFGDRCTQELKLESITLDEDPGQLVMAIGAAGLKAEQSATATERGATVVLNSIIRSPLKRLLANWLLRWTKARVRDRENLRFERTRLFGRVRRIFLTMGHHFAAAGVLTDRRDVFHLTVDELLGAIEGAGVTTDIKALAALRKAEHEASLRRPDPPERIEMRGAHILGARAGAVKAAEAVEGAETRTGLACCRGVVTARVRVIEDPRVEALAPGEILVARHTDPGWIAVFANAAGVIAERGSLLSHSAIVAREMGVPCVVAVKGVTGWLKTGDTVRLDGGAGTIERVSGTG